MRRLVLLALGLTAGLSLSAAVRTWKGGGSTLRWSDGSNWVGGVAPAAGDTAAIPNGKTAWASHFTEEKGGDLTVLRSLAGVRLDGANAAFELDVENDGVLATASFSFSTPVSGPGRFTIKNTVNNDRQVSLFADNSAFTGTYEFTNAAVRVKDAQSIAPGCRINFSGRYGNHELKLCAGTYSNDIHVITAVNSPVLGGVRIDDRPAVTNLGTVVLEPTCASAYIQNMYCQTVSNLPNTVSALRLAGAVGFGPGGLFGRARLAPPATGDTHVYFYGPNRGTTFGSPFGYNESKSEDHFVHCHGADFLRGLYFSHLIVDLGGCDQPNLDLTNMGNSTLKTDRPAAVAWRVSNTTEPQTMNNVTLNGPLSLTYNFDYNNKRLTFNTVTGTMSGRLVVKKAHLYLTENVRLPRLERLATTSKDKYNPSRIYIQGAAFLNPGRLALEAAGRYGSIDIAEGVQLDVRSFESGGVSLHTGVYGSAEARAAHPDLVAEDHVLDSLTGTGTVFVRGIKGMVILFK